MNKLKTLALAAIVTGFAGAAGAASVTIVGGTPDTPAANNNFLSNLTAAFSGPLGFNAGSTFTLDEDARLTFTEVGAESSFNNSFTVDGLGSMSENGNFGFGSDFLTDGGESLSHWVTAGALSGLTFFNNRVVDPITTAVIGDIEFGVFFDSSLASHETFFLAFDDNGAGPDDNHDDYIIRVDVSTIPVPAAGLMLLSALGLGAGLARRRRRS